MNRAQLRDKDDLDDTAYFFDWAAHKAANENETRRRTASIWDDGHKVARLTQMWEGAVPAVDIAKALGCTRNAVIGKANRMKLSFGRGMSLTEKRRRGAQEINWRRLRKR